MSKAEYNANRQRLAEIQGVDLSAGTHNCHHYKIFRSEARRDHKLRRDLNKLDNLFLLPIEDHERLHQVIELREPTPKTNRRSRQRKKRR